MLNAPTSWPTALPCCLTAACRSRSAGRRRFSTAMRAWPLPRPATRLANTSCCPGKAEGAGRKLSCVQYLAGIGEGASCLAAWRNQQLVVTVQHTSGAHLRCALPCPAPLCFCAGVAAHTMGWGGCRRRCAILRRRKRGRRLRGTSSTSTTSPSEGGVPLLFWQRRDGVGQSFRCSMGALGEGSMSGCCGELAAEHVHCTAHSLAEEPALQPHVNELHVCCCTQAHRQAAA